jgi:hypothetical protein
MFTYSHIFFLYIIGLLYYWAKYYKKSVSLIIGADIENWSSQNHDGDEVVLEQEIKNDILQSHGCVAQQDANDGRYAHNARYKKYVPDRYNMYVPYRDFRHFTGSQKPWLIAPDMLYLKKFEDVRSAEQYWYFLFQQIIEHLNMDVDLETLDIPRNAFGGFPTHNMVRDTFNAKLKLKL